MFFDRMADREVLKWDKILIVDVGIHLGIGFYVQSMNRSL